MIRNNLKYLLEIKNININQFSTKSGISYNTIKNIYYNKTNKIMNKTLNRICKTLNCKVNDILEYIKDEL